MPLKHPARRELDDAQQAGFVRMVADRTELKGGFLAEENGSPAHGQLAYMTGDQPSADDDPFRLRPRRQGQELLDYCSEFLGELFDSSVDDTGRQRVLAPTLEPLQDCRVPNGSSCP